MPFAFTIKGIQLRAIVIGKKNIHLHGISESGWIKNALVKQILKVNWRRRTYGLLCKG